MHAERLPNGYLLRGATGVFPLGQDSVLLADFAKCPPHGKALDLGCGSGVLSLLLLGRYPALHVTAIEQDAHALTLAEENCACNELAHRFTLLQGDVRNISTLITHAAFDFVICNPPYFPAASGKAHATLSAARQQTDGIAPFVHAAAFALRFGGKAAFVYRPEHLTQLLCALRAEKLEPKRLRLVHQRAHSAPSALLVESQKGAKEGMIILPPLLIEAPDGSHSEEYNKIYSI